MKPLKIYFSAALVQKDEYGSFYRRIIDKLRELEHQVFEDVINISPQDITRKTDKELNRYYRKVLRWISNSDLVVLEVSSPSSLSVGHKLSLALEKGRPVVAFYMEGRDPYFFLGREDEKLFFCSYSSQDLEKLIGKNVKEASCLRMTRFNMYISAGARSFLEYISQVKKTTRAAYVRKLIARAMQNEIKRKSFQP